jgi:hypothetical protein
MIGLAGTAYAGKTLGLASAWPIVFAIGTATATTYLALSLFSLPDKTRQILLQTRLTTRLILTGLIFAPILTGISYWIYQTGSVEALPIFPVFIIVFYAWILLQGYFITIPVSQLLNRTENRFTGETGAIKSTIRTLSRGMLFMPVIPLVYGVWAISNWLNSSYQNIPGSSEKILAWTLLITVLIVSTYFLTIQWSWKIVKNEKPQTAIFVGGTFLVVWGYLLYRATMLGIAYITANQSSNPIIDMGLVVVSIIGSMQTFARKAIRKSDARWSRILPFLVFAFGTVFAVAQYYFILQVVVTRADLTMSVNATVFATGLVIMMFLIKRHLTHHDEQMIDETGLIAQQNTSSVSATATTTAAKFHLPSFHFRKQKTMEEEVQELREEVENSKQQEQQQYSQNEPTETEESPTKFEETTQNPDSELEDS